MNNTRLLRNTVLLTASGILMRCIALSFQVWLAGQIGRAGIGLFQLVSSVQLLCATLAISGIRFAATRLISEEMGLGRSGGISRVMALCLGYGLLFGLGSGLILWLCAEPVGFLWIGDARTVLSLRWVAWSMPFLSMASVFSGYFTATGRVWKSALAQVCEQLVRIGLVAVFLERAPAGDIEQCCRAVTAGGSFGELFSFLMYLLLYLTDRRKHLSRGSIGPRLPGRMLAVALPLALSAYARTGLSTLQHLLVPRGLKASGLTGDTALAGYGLIHGMALPIVLFPSCLLLALSELLVPALTEAQVSGRREDISRRVNDLLEKSLLFSLGAAAALYANADALGSAVYHTPEAGQYIRILALLAPVMYLDMVTDGCLKGLGEQLWSMGVNIADSALSVLLVLFLLPRYALGGYISILWVTELFNFVLSLWRLRKKSTLRPRTQVLLLTPLCALGAVQGLGLLSRLCPLPPDAGLLCALPLGLCCLLYGILLRLCGIFPPLRRGRR